MRPLLLLLCAALPGVADEAVGEWWEEWTAEPPPGKDTVPLLRSPREGDEAPGVPPLRRGERFEAVSHSADFLALRGGGLFLPTRFAAGKEQPQEWVQADYGRMRSGACGGAHAERTVSREEGSAAGLPTLDAGPELPAAMLLLARRCAAACLVDYRNPGTPDRRCRRFTVYDTGKCMLVSLPCSPPGSTPAAGAWTFARIFSRSRAALQLQSAERLVHRLLQPPPPPPAPLAHSVRLALLGSIARLSLEKERAKARDDLAKALELHERIAEARAMLLGKAPVRVRLPSPPSAQRADRAPASSGRSGADAALRPPPPPAPPPPRLWRRPYGDGAASTALGGASARSAEPRLHKAAFAAGCFWRLQRALAAAAIPNVRALTVGYMGGFGQQPTPEEVKSGTTGHAEVVHVLYSGDSGGAVYKELLRIFWSVHNPFEVGRQGADIGTQFRSAVYTSDEAQQAAATASRTERERDPSYNPSAQPIRTEIAPSSAFWPAPPGMGDHCRAAPPAGG
eukprot:TRINITY_DN3327_c0_g2_i1.p1 TRINITY_DN3327_c0_g2~~TRINITY_DN3327_c0_g2_i1.p1  ORF type:complete len:543 (+),score=154.60 TRINITY_DN3327_c0_g2_i1:99-1631(+)